jgi:hypothetical protein
MDSHNYPCPPAKRPRLGEPPNGSQLGCLPIPSSHPIQSVQSIGYFTSPSTQQGNIHPTRHFVPVTGHFNSFDPRSSGFGGQWMGGRQPLLGVVPNGSYPNQPLSNLPYQSYLQLQLPYSEQPTAMVQPQSSMFPLPGLPCMTGTSPWTPPPQSYTGHVPNSLTNHKPFQNSSDSSDQLMSEPNVQVMDEYPTLEYLQPEESEDVETETVCFGMVSP